MPSAEYMKNYRATHPDYAERNRERSREVYEAFKAEHGHAPKKVHASRYASRSYDVAKRDFAGCDGEGATLAGKHRYVLLRLGDDVLTDDNGLSWRDCLEFISTRPSDKTYVSFFFDYDVTMILRQAGWKRNIELIKKGTCWYGDYLVEYRPRAKFRVTKMAKSEDDGKWHPVRPGVTISDTCKLFQTAFVNVIKTWEALDEPSRELIAAGKLKRATEEHLSDEMIEYNRLECVALEDVMGKLREACEAEKLRPTNWEGPGYLATALLRKYRVPRRDDYISTWPDVVQYAGRAAMYGGRFEPVWLGPVGDVIELDINSAYPAAMLEMPCFKHAQWGRVNPDGYDVASTVPALLRVHVRPDTDQLRPYLYGLPHRTKKGRVLWTGETLGWYWNFEVAQAHHQSVEVLDVWEWRTTCVCDPCFAYNTELFEYRKSLGKTGRGRVLKLALNSQYGKLAQTIGHPVYSNHVLSGFITAKCRALISELIHYVSQCGSRSDIRCGSEIVAIATDAVFVRSNSAMVSHLRDLPRSSDGCEPVPRLRTGSDLGALDWLELSDFFHVASGIYFSAEDRPKTRGVPTSLVEEYEEPIKDAYRVMVESQDCQTGVARLPYIRFIGLREAVARGHPGQLGSFVALGGDRGRAIGYDWSNKRHPRPVAEPRGPGDPTGTGPWIRPPDSGIETTPYGKVVPGCYDKGPEELDDSPDWIAPVLPYED